jgi:hypothetical protein
MSNILFIHGTGVREPHYSKTYAVIEQKIEQSLPGWQPMKCYWGEECGARFHKKGDSIPKYATARAVGDGANQEDETLILWQLLYGDPCHELALASAPEAGDEQQLEFDRSKSSARNERKELIKDIAGFRPRGDFEALIEQNHLTPYWTEGLRKMVASAEFQAAAANATLKRNEFVAIVARAITAQAILLADEQGLPSPSGETRDALVKKFVEELQGDSRSLIGSAISSVGRLIERVRVGSVAVGVGAGYYLSRRMTTYAAERRRGAISDALAPGAGDILLYQTRADGIANFIRKQIEATPGPVLLLAHSLGGIACVDLLVEARPPNVIGLVTAGSQAPLLYEIDCLKTLRPTQSLPRHFPPWLNFYDPHDFLSYQGRKVFAKRVEDVEIESKQPFPKSHSAYWNVPLTWDKIAPFAKQCLKSHRNA